MIIQTRTEELLKRVDNNYELVIAVSKRARQLADEHKAHEGKKLEVESEVTESAEELAKGEFFVVR